MNRAIGHYLQLKGLYVIPNIRWGDENGKFFEVEFFDENGDTIDVVTTPVELLELVQSY